MDRNKLIYIALIIIVHSFVMVGCKKTNQIENIPETEVNLLILVNKDNKLPDDYSINLTVVSGKNGKFQVASVLLNNLKEMQAAAAKERISIDINSAYRTKDEQHSLVSGGTSEYIENRGMPIISNSTNQEEITNNRNSTPSMPRNGNMPPLIGSTATAVALPGYSEHETGLAIDFTTTGNDANKLLMWNWLSRNAYKYGFILRYPENKTNITGYMYEPWHYRYVGKDKAKIIFDNNLCLEEYLEYYE